MAILFHLFFLTSLLVNARITDQREDDSEIFDARWNHLASQSNNQEVTNDVEDPEAAMMMMMHDHRHHHMKKRSITTSLAYSIHLDPDSNLKLSWTPDYEGQTVHFRLEVARSLPQSWYALGFSDRGEWAGADLCVAWEDWKGNLIVQDGHVDLSTKAIHPDGHSNDCLDSSFRRFQSLQHHHNNNSGARAENNAAGWAVIDFSRPFDTCQEEDYLIEDGTTHIVYAYGSGPLYRIDGVKPTDSQTGFQRTRLLKPTSQLPPVTVQTASKFNKDLRPLLITNDRLKVPGQETTYWCRVVRLPEQFRNKHHIIQFESAIEKGRESLVHHMEVFHCEAPRNEVIPEYSGPCSDPDRPEATRVCKRVIAAWAYGAGPFVYPAEAGLSIGGPDFNPYVMLEVHYNNPGLRGDWEDSSGVRMWYTSKLRAYDAGVMELGLEYTDKMAIPPGQPAYTLTGYCLPQCTAVSVPKSGITIFGSQLHTHLLGKRVVTQHFRGKEELPELNRDNHYSTHYQEIRLLSHPVKILPGDALLTTCWFDSSDQENVTLGGFSISDEMCVNYVHYFPRIDLEVCKSSVSWQALANYFKFLNEWEKQPTSPTKGVSDNYKSVDWTPLRAGTLLDYYTEAPISMQCNQSSGDRFPGDWEGLQPVKVPTPPSSTPFTIERQSCENKESIPIILEP